VRQRAVAHDADAVLGAVGEHLPLLAAVEQVVADLDHVDPPHRHAFLQLLDREVGDAHEAGLAAIDDVLQGAHSLLERGVGVWPVDEQHVGVVGPEALEADLDLA
jgi:hypothetical protein